MEAQIQLAKATDIQYPLGPGGGLRFYTSPRGFRIISINYWADPTHDHAWELAERRKYTSRDWRREMELDWTSPSGSPFLPEFSELGKERFLYPANKLIAGPVYRSFDLGRRRPACVWFQYSPKADRLWYYREFMPHDLQHHEFRDAVKFLSGQIQWVEVPPRAQRWIEVYAAKPSGAHCDPMPKENGYGGWFPFGVDFIDISGKEALQGTANAPTREEGVTKNIFAEGGLFLNWINPSVEGRYQILRRYLKEWGDGSPGMWVDPQCEEWITAMDGALAYPKATEANPIPTAPRDDGHYINMADAATYGPVLVCPADAPRPTRPAPTLEKAIRGQDVPRPGALDLRRREPWQVAEELDQIPFNETRRR